MKTLQKIAEEILTVPSKNNTSIFFANSNVKQTSVEVLLQQQDSLLKMSISLKWLSLNEKLGTKHFVDLPSAHSMFSQPVRYVHCQSFSTINALSHQNVHPVSGTS